LQEGERDVAPAQALHEAVKSRFGRITFKKPLQTSHIQFQGDGAAHDLRQPPSQITAGAWRSNAERVKLGQERDSAMRG
ncbi:MAG: hypothetical protein ACREDW_01645, partial [Aestuariivirgaceae bacterium]